MFDRIARGQKNIVDKLESGKFYFLEILATIRDAIHLFDRQGKYIGFFFAAANRNIYLTFI